MLPNKFKFIANSKYYWFIKGVGSLWSCYSDKDGKPDGGIIDDFTSNQIERNIKTKTWEIIPDKWEKHVQRMIDA